MGRAVSGHRLRLRSLPGHGRAGPCPQVGLGLAVRVRVASAGCAPATAGASSIRLPLRAVSGSPLTRLPSRSAQGWRRRAGGHSGAPLGGGGRAGRVRLVCHGRGWRWRGRPRAGRGATVHAAGRAVGAVHVRAASGVRLGGAGECVARRSGCSIVAHLHGMRMVSKARHTRDSRCLAANYLRAGPLAADAGAPSEPHFIVVAFVSSHKSWESA